MFHFGNLESLQKGYSLTAVIRTGGYSRTGNPSRDKNETSLFATLLSPPVFITELGSHSGRIAQARNSKNITPLEDLRLNNVLACQILDSALGLVLMYFLVSGSTAQNLANICMAYGDRVAEELRALLEWLMGAPAGLKLNSPLTHFLGKFFQYHIYLWTVYLSILRPVLGSLLYYGSMSGVWGLTVQLALFQDIFATMTIHIYCFYVYAARLYRLQVYALGSLWRLFRGKKWNVLRQRVDSAVYDADQLFVGTLLFTVLLFLLPTTGLYYVVFSVLRVVVLTVQGVVTRLRYHITSTPWWSVCLWMIGSTTLIDKAVLIAGCFEKDYLVLYMQGTRPSLKGTMNLTWKPDSSRQHYSWSTIVKNLLQGHLIYPWIDMKRQ
ncbi:phosphatidylinositol N-acetylglucosaminyltransferase subunit Q-like isoform X2 [Mya arenaria]|uniref:phosphatidylinositol N-acetylglucosaminyltransferase subunit Q-like isoform X2 n=1 Tax=Mya arenaria TaxID=6604 RepID=UPI0022DEBD8E|nr:phosphatidylinositol N-acetylglucosaminyltransferase subunit Q-like isoform X2 [Mya arenaria]